MFCVSWLSDSHPRGNFGLRQAKIFPPRARWRCTLNRGAHYLVGNQLALLAA